MPSRALLRLALVLGLTASSGCAGAGLFGFLGHSLPLDDAQRRYTRFMRWAEFGRASEFVDPEERESFLARTAELADVRFTDYEVLSNDVKPVLGEATLRVTYRAYRLSSASEIVFDERQVWYRDELTRAWRVRSVLEERKPGAPQPSS